ncbi:hypothetical protein EC973_008943, partial [Apophysomyces ossiformis]
MAVDKHIIAEGPGNIRPPESDITDDWLYNRDITGKQLESHIGERNTVVLKEMWCKEAESCGYYSVRCPCRPEYLDRRPLLNNVQHKHSIPGTSSSRTKKPCAYGRSAGGFHSLPLAARRYLWYQFRRRSEDLR